MSASSSPSTMRRIAQVAVGTLVAVTLAACKGGASVTVDISVPRPLVEPLDVEMGVYFDDKLRTYVHEEELEDYGAYRIDIGASQAPVFAQVFDAMFDRVVAVAPVGDEAAADEPANWRFRPVDGPQARLDAVLVPSIDEVQFAIPEQTGGEFYEVWIRYRLRLVGADGEVLGEWPVIGYGKANERNYGTIDQKETGLNAAAVWALRDAAAWLSFQFRDQAEVQTWLTSLEDTP